MAELYTEAIGAIGNLIGPLALFGTFVAVAIVVYMMVNARYPQVKFHVIEGKRQLTLKMRLFGEKVVENNLIQLLLRGEGMIGFKLSEYDYYFTDDRKRTYLATRRGVDLIPLRIKETELELAELGMAREIAIRYVNTIDSVKNDMDKQNPIILALVSILPLSVLVLLTGVMFYMILNDAIPKMISANIEVSQLSAQTARLSAQTASSLQEVVAFLNKQGGVINPQMNMTNMTNISITG
jgi:hypothetical protein